MSRIWGLDLIRAAAVTGVLLSHLQAHTGQNFIQKIFPVGPVLGVELFFVLSGFLIGQIIIHKVLKEDFGVAESIDFMKRRWFRTLPNYYLFFLIMLYLQWNVGKDHIWSFLFFTQNLFSKPVLGFYGVTWSLSVEEVFYATFPISILLIGIFVKNRNYKLLLTILAFIITPSLIRLCFYDGADFTSRDFRQAVIIRLDSIGYGILAAYVKIKAPVIWSKITKQGALAILPFWYLFIYSGFSGLTIDDWSTVFFPLCSICIALTLPFFDSLKTYEGILSKPISMIADISYSLYLCHIPLIIVANKHLNIKYYLSGYALEIFYIAASIVLAYIVNRLWEKPMTNLRDKKFLFTRRHD